MWGRNTITMTPKLPPQVMFHLKETLLSGGPLGSQFCGNFFIPSQSILIRSQLLVLILPQNVNITIIAKCFSLVIFQNKIFFIDHVIVETIVLLSK